MTQAKQRAQGSGRSLADSPGHLLHRAQQLAADAFGAHFPRAELTIRQYAILSAVDAHPGLTQTKLVRITGVDRSTMADLIARLQERGLVARGRLEEDARAKSVTLTAAGKAALAACTPAARAADQAILDALPKSKRELFVSLLQRIIGELDASERKRAKKRLQDMKELAKKEKKLRKKIAAQGKSARAAATAPAETGTGKRPKALKAPKRANPDAPKAKGAVEDVAAEAQAAAPKRTA